MDTYKGVRKKKGRFKDDIRKHNEKKNKKKTDHMEKEETDQAFHQAVSKIEALAKKELQQLEGNNKTDKLIALRFKDDAIEHNKITDQKEIAGLEKEELDVFEDLMIEKVPQQLQVKDEKLGFLQKHVSFENDDSRSLKSFQDSTYTFCKEMAYFLCFVADAMKIDFVFREALCLFLNYGYYELAQMVYGKYLENVTDLGLALVDLTPSNKMLEDEVQQQRLRMMFIQQALSSGSHKTDDLLEILYEQRVDTNLSLSDLVQGAQDLPHNARVFGATQILGRHIDTVYDEVTLCGENARTFVPMVKLKDVCISLPMNSDFLVPVRVGVSVDRYSAAVCHSDLVKSADNKTISTYTSVYGLDLMVAGQVLERCVLLKVTPPEDDERREQEKSPMGVLYSFPDMQQWYLLEEQKNWVLENKRILFYRWKRDYYVLLNFSCHLVFVVSGDGEGGAQSYLYVQHKEEQCEYLRREIDGAPQQQAHLHENLELAAEETNNANPAAWNNTPQLVRKPWDHLQRKFILSVPSGKGKFHINYIAKQKMDLEQKVEVFKNKLARPREQYNMKLENQPGKFILCQSCDDDDDDGEKSSTLKQRTTYLLLQKLYQLFKKVSSKCLSRPEALYQVQFKKRPDLIKFLDASCQQLCSSKVIMYFSKLKEGGYGEEVIEKGAEEGTLKVMDDIVRLSLCLEEEQQALSGCHDDGLSESHGGEGATTFLSMMLALLHSRMEQLRREQAERGTDGEEGVRGGQEHRPRHSKSVDDSKINVHSIQHFPVLQLKCKDIIRDRDSTKEPSQVMDCENLKSPEENYSRCVTMIMKSVVEAISDIATVKSCINLVHKYKTEYN